MKRIEEFKISLAAIVLALQPYMPGIKDEDINSYTPTPNGEGVLIETEIENYELVRVDFKYNPDSDAEEIVYISNGTKEGTFALVKLKKHSQPVLV